ncbi:33 kDa chaperonin [Paenibacillus montaniterrae]|uniref:33 kDa chaperonin n=1 Tax=Paenibacillus montaniterrae TaxID=429341 RepID=A0A919YPB9_9BACL|nr:Hsp33 family molecular chaperone HslO [Paenibacillus montaniterrae]GIP18152.1 33 kDa chaperonin [Paenibacillus montaniterrae]
MNDYLVKGISHNKQVRAYAAITTETIEEARRRHDMLSVASVVLGRSITAGVILGSMLKGEQKLTIKINGGGPIGTILVDANARGNVRGLVSNPHAPAPLNQQGAPDIRSAVGTNGNISVTKDTGLNHPFIGQVPIVSGEIGEDFASYLLHSEQVPSFVGIDVLVNPDYTIKAAGGFIIQPLPNTEENVSILEATPVQFQCECSRERIANAIVSLGSGEIQSIIDTDGQAEAQCHFCNEKYQFSRENLEEIKKLAI